jgi:hypothetical protein
VKGGSSRGNTLGETGVFKLLVNTYPDVLYCTSRIVHVGSTPVNATLILPGVILTISKGRFVGDGVGVSVGVGVGVRVGEDVGPGRNGVIKGRPEFSRTLNPDFCLTVKRLLPTYLFITF